LQIFECGFIERLMKAGRELIRGCTCQAVYRIVHMEDSLPVTMLYGEVLSYLRSGSSLGFQKR
jgi:hypothetical protein